MRPMKSPGTGAVRRPKKSLICVLAMRMAMPLVKPTMTGRGMNLTAVPRPVSRGRQQNAGHEGADEQAVEAVAGEDAEDDDDEGAGGATDLVARAAEGGDGEAGDDRGVETGLRRGSGGDGEGHGERQGDEADGDAGDEVGGEFSGAVIAQARTDLGVHAARFNETLLKEAVLQDRMFCGFRERPRRTNVVLLVRICR